MSSMEASPYAVQTKKPTIDKEGVLCFFVCCCCFVFNVVLGHIVIHWVEVVD